MLFTPRPLPKSAVLAIDVPPARTSAASWREFRPSPDRLREARKWQEFVNEEGAKHFHPVGLGILWMMQLQRGCNLDDSWMMIGEASSRVFRLPRVKIFGSESIMTQPYLVISLLVLCGVWAIYHYTN